jgi:hypothetical protein
MTPESRNSEVRIDVHCWATTRWTHSRCNKYVSNNWVTSVAMQQRCKQAFPTTERLCFLRGPCKVVIKKSSVETDQWRAESSRVSRRQPAGIWVWDHRKLSWQLQNNDKKEIRRWKEDFMCDLKWQWDCYKSVARIRLVKIEKPSACETVNYKVCRSEIVLYCL